MWYLDNDNRIYCLDGTEKYYLQFFKTNPYTVYLISENSQIGSNYGWVYKDGNYITGTRSDTTYYLYRNGPSATSGVRMRTTATTLTFEPVSS